MLTKLIRGFSPRISLHHVSKHHVFETPINFNFLSLNLYFPERKEIKVTQDPFEYSKASTKEPESDYDLIIACDRLRDLNPSTIKRLPDANGDDDQIAGLGIDGWNMTINPKFLWNDLDKNGFLDHTNFLFDKPNKNVKRIAVTGIYNVGKTFILSNLSEEKLPDEGSQTRTQGLSIKQFENQPDMIIMDSAGKHSTIELTDEMSLSDKISSEKILENTIFDLANYHICVVNELTWPDQHHFEMLFDKIWRSKDESHEATQQWPLIVIHNFKDKTLQEFYDENLVEQIQKAYQKGIFRCSNKDIKDGLDAKQEFNKLLKAFIKKGNESTLFQSKNTENIKQYINSKNFGDFWFDSQKRDTTNSVKHYFLVQNDVIGAAFNYFVFDELRQAYIKSAIKNTFCLNDVLKALDQQTKRFVKFTTNTGKSLIPSSDTKFTNIGCVGKEKNGKQRFKLIINPQLITTPNEWSLVKLRKPNELDYNALYVAATEWIPKYDIQYSSDGNVCNIFMELPGKIINAETKMDENDPSKFIVSGERIKEDQYIYEGSNDQMGRIFSEFKFSIKLQDGFEHLDDNKNNRKNGVAHFTVAKKKPQEAIKQQWDD